MTERIFVGFQQIEMPDHFGLDSTEPEADRLIGVANEQIERFMLSDQEVIENFVTCDFHLTQCALQWIRDNHLLTGERFCELGSGYGVVAMLAARMGMESIGIEIEQVLVDEANALAAQLSNDAAFHCGSFIPRETLENLDMDREIRNVTIEEDDVYREIGLAMNDFDLFFAFPWPGEQVFFERVVDKWAASGAMLLTYRGRDGMQLQRKD
jgi:hypothetical protein